MEVKSVNLSGDVKCLAVSVPGSDEPVMVPLFSQLPRRQARKINDDMQKDADGTLDAFFREYLGDMVDEMSLAKWNELVRAWTSTSEEDAGASLGE
jgi:hypothetical protein